MKLVATISGFTRTNSSEVRFDFLVQQLMNQLDEKTAVYEPLKRLEQWVEQADWTAYDTFDGLSSPYARLFTFGSGFLKQVWQQSVRRFPVNLRPVLGIKPSMSTKAMGFFAQGYLKLYQTYADPVALGQSEIMFEVAR